MGTFTSFSKAIKSGLDNAPRLAKRDRPTIPEILKLGGKYFVFITKTHLSTKQFYAVNSPR